MLALPVIPRVPKPLQVEGRKLGQAPDLSVEVHPGVCDMWINLNKPGDNGLFNVGSYFFHNDMEINFYRDSGPPRSLVLVRMKRSPKHSLG